MSFFEQENAQMELDLPKVAVQKWKEKLSRGEKIAAKLEFKKNNIVELHIIDEREHIFILSGFNKKSEQSLVIKDKEALAMVQYKSRSAKDEIDGNLEEISDQLIKQNLNKNDKSNVVEIDDTEEYFRHDRLKLLHQENVEKKQDYKIFRQDQQFKENLKLDLMAYLRDLSDGVTIQQLQQMKQFNYDAKDVKKILQDITTVKREKNEYKYYLKDSCR